MLLKRKMKRRKLPAQVLLERTHDLFSEGQSGNDRSQPDPDRDRGADPSEDEPAEKRRQGLLQLRLFGLPDERDLS